ncbi:MAG: orotidine-5'-phosphate decarboxylase [Nocardioidaceae bacterium]
METFGARLHASMRSRGALCVGIDPHASLLADWGLDDNPDGLERFCLTCVDALAGQVAVLKPQSAFFERMGSAGIAVLERVVSEARQAGALVLLDVKRGDMGSTMQGYAEAYLEESSPLAVDAITVNPYLGFESLRPALDAAKAHGTGVFVLALTSNPDGPRFQRAATDHGSVAGAVLAAVRAENAAATRLGSVGAVVGATLPTLDEDVDTGGPLLAPGYGVQGGSAGHLRELFGDAFDRVLPSTSRGVLQAGPTVAALRRAARRCLDELTSP